MKAFNASLQQPRQVQIIPAGKFIPTVAATAHEIMALLSAAILAATIVAVSVWFAGIEMTDVLGAGIWGVGIIFFGLAVDGKDPKAILQVVTGVALVVLAWLQANVSADYIIVSGVLVAGWAATSLFKRLKKPL
jgi:hypothetical protein